MTSRSVLRPEGWERGHVRPLTLPPYAATPAQEYEKRLASLLARAAELDSGTGRGGGGRAAAGSDSEATKEGDSADGGRSEEAGAAH